MIFFAYESTGFTLKASEEQVLLVVYILKIYTYISSRQISYRVGRQGQMPYVTILIDLVVFHIHYSLYTNTLIAKTKHHLRTASNQTDHCMSFLVPQYLHYFTLYIDNLSSGILSSWPNQRSISFIQRHFRPARLGT